MPNTNQVSEFYGWYLRHNSRTVWKNLYDAGVDLFTTGPANNPQSFQALQNVLPSMSGGFRRRWGVKPMGSAIAYAHNAIVRTFPYNNPQDSSDATNTADTNVWFGTDNQNFYALKDDGTAFTGYGPSNFSSALGTANVVTSRGWVYYGNGIDTPRKVNPSYTTANTDSLLGIAYPGFGSNSTSIIDYPSALLSNNSSNVYLPSTTLYPASTGYGYTTTPTVTITDPTGSGSGAAVSVTLGVHGEIIAWTLVSGGSNYVQAEAAVDAPPTGGVQGFLTLYVQRNSGAPNFGQVVGADLAGPMSFAAGRSYTVALQNSKTGHTSDVYITNLGRSKTSGEFLTRLTDQYSQIANASGVNIPVYAASTSVTAGFTQNELVISVPATGLDPQVDTVILLATSDGGSVGTLYEVTTLPLSNFTLVSDYYQYYYVDRLPDTYSDLGSSPASSGVVNASDYATKLTFNSSQYEYNATGGGQIRTAGGVSSGVLTDYIVADNFGLAVPTAATIVGVEATIEWSGQEDGTGILQNVSLYNGGSAIGTVKTPVVSNTLAGDTTFIGGTEDIWGATLTPAIVNGSTFGFGIQVQAENVFPGTTRSFFYKWTLAVYYTTPTSSVAVTDTLLAANIWAYTDADGSIYGILENEAPLPAGFLYPTLHQGRMFATDGKTVFYSKSLEEVTTPTGLITSKWEECWPAEYQLPLALNNEKVIGIKSDGTNLHVGTDKSIFTVYGSDPGNFSVPSVAFSQTGILSNDCWTVVFAEGQPAGFVWLTQDFKVMHSDFATYKEIGTEIYPELQQFDSTNLARAKIISLTQGPYNFVILQFPVTSQNIPRIWIWETRLMKWYQWIHNSDEIDVTSAFVYQYPGYGTLPSGITAGQKFFFYWFLYDSTLQVKYFDPTATVDTGWYDTAPISWIIWTSWQDLGDATAIKVVNELDLVGADGPYLVSLFGANSQSQFLNGLNVLAYGSTVTGPIAALQTNKFYCAGAATAAKYYSVSIMPYGTPGTDPDVLTEFTMEHYPIARI